MRASAADNPTTAILLIFTSISVSGQKPGLGRGQVTSLKLLWGEASKGRRCCGGGNNHTTAKHAHVHSWASCHTAEQNRTSLSSSFPYAPTSQNTPATGSKAARPQPQTRRQASPPVTIITLPDPRRAQAAASYTALPLCVSLPVQPTSILFYLTAGTKANGFSLEGGHHAECYFALRGVLFA